MLCKCAGSVRSVSYASSVSVSVSYASSGGGAALVMPAPPSVS